jgi:hypothetical protein
LTSVPGVAADRNAARVIAASDRSRNCDTLFMSTVMPRMVIDVPASVLTGPCSSMRVSALRSSSSSASTLPPAPGRAFTRTWSPVWNDASDGCPLMSVSVLTAIVMPGRPSSVNGALRQVHRGEVALEAQVVAERHLGRREHAVADGALGLELHARQHVRRHAAPRRRCCRW